MKQSQWNEAMNLLDTDLVESFVKKQENMAERKKNKVLWLRRGAVAACFMLVFAAFAGYFMFGGDQSKVAATIMLDVNPSLEIKVDEDEKVLEVLPLNEDGKKIVADLDTVSDDLIETVDTIILSMIDNGYLDEIKNAVLLSIECEDTEKTDLLSAKLSERIFEMIGYDGAVIMQTVEYKNNEEKRIAQKYGISYGKYCFIQEILKLYPELEFEDLVKMSVSDMKILANNGTTDKNTNQRFISMEKAMQIAMEYFRITDYRRIYQFSSDIRHISLYESNVGYNEGLVFSLSFKEALDDQYVYHRISLNAVTGDIIRTNSQSIETPDAFAPPNVITEDEMNALEAIEIACQNIGISVDDGHTVYCQYIPSETLQPSFWSIRIQFNDIEYEIDIEGKMGDIMQKDLMFYVNNTRIVINQLVS